VYNYYRTYDPSTGRYLESDPIGLAAGLNTYSYVSNMPTMQVDPFGLFGTAGHAQGRLEQARRDQLQQQLSECDEDDEDCLQKCLDEYYGDLLGWAKSASLLGAIPVGLTIASSAAQDELGRQANRNRYTGARNSALGGPHGYATGARQARLLGFFSRFNLYATAAAVGSTTFVITAYANCAVRCSK
jgi:uncharacterized protein RhaS with RHS repeats